MALIVIKAVHAARTSVSLRSSKSLLETIRMVHVEYPCGARISEHGVGAESMSGV